MPMEIRADLHTHTQYSDGEGEPRDNIKYALARGLNAVAITDHNTFRGALAAREYIRGNAVDEIMLIIGNEVRTDKGDVLLLCIDYPGTDQVPTNVQLLIDWAHSNNCIVIPAHPFDALRHGIGMDISRYKWDAIEVFNAGASPMANKRALNISRKMGIPGIANSDAHIPELVGVAYTRVYVDDPSPEGLFKAIINGNVSISTGYPGPSLILKRLSWSLRRRLRLLL
ncbi:PHP domain-containing protein [Vulcanisaeta thermophila]|uniref:PHP domain-containing protein n=1 Tax=Vulcanisaeta thermophila TaxID=867917 RepID=UPI000A62731C|nr:CehA/McbA family metallohydrolase [Vulcanisaeta thermophila]